MSEGRWISADRFCTIRGVGWPVGVRFSDTLINQFRGRRMEPRPVVVRTPGGGSTKLSAHRSEQRHRQAEVRQPDEQHHQPDFMRIFGLNSSFTERQVRIGVRYSFSGRLQVIR